MRIAIAIATRGNDIYAKLLHFCLEQSKIYNAEVITSESGFSAAEAQGNLFNYIKHEGIDYVLLVDSDVCPPYDALEKLLACKADIVTAPVLHYDPGTQDVHYNIHYEAAEHDKFKRVYARKDSGVEEIISTSFACLLISRKVFDTFAARGESLCEWSTLLDNDWRSRVSDNIFCMKARALGFQIHVCWEIKNCTHHRYAKLNDQLVIHFRKFFPETCKSEITEVHP